MKLLQFIESLPRETKRLILMVGDSILLPCALYVAFVLQTTELFPDIKPYWWLFALIVLTSIPVFVRIGLYRAIIRYMGSKMVFTVVKGVTIATFILSIGLILTKPVQTPWSVLGIYWALAMLYIGGSRLIARDYFLGRKFAQENRKRVIIYGSGAAGAQLALGLQSGREYLPVAFIDDNPEDWNSVVSGIRVYAPIHIEKLVQDDDIEFILLALPSVSRSRRRRIIEQLEPLPVHVKTIPGLSNLVGHTAEVDDIREVEIEDLLGRDPVPPNKELLGACITGKSVMVTGAGGSIGSELCRQIIEQKPAKLILFEKSEFALYEIDQELNNRKQILNRNGHSIEIVPILGSVTHQSRIESVLEKFKVETVYHAAAYKHVPLVEQNPIEGIRNNIFGTLATAKAAKKTKVKSFVLISTDKAVRPTNVMGATKRVAELILQALADTGCDTNFSMVRFGNVLASSGSVVPLFRRQIKQGGPVTVTHPEINRYFMTIPEASQLVIQAGSMAQGGDVFVLDMGEPVKIVEMAKRMVQLSGLSVITENNPDGDIEIQFTGLRPGEKLYEELLIGENVSGTHHPLIMRAEEDKFTWLELSQYIDQIDIACHKTDHIALRQLLQQLVQQYKPQAGITDFV
ncbi:MAG: polysaccharide biosynthesis protein, partial [Gammaproteobacteria bacterium]|nr:polysaccharide biosynthesis protein [Gammaproteobacteria bacterium]